MPSFEELFPESPPELSLPPWPLLESASDDPLASTTLSAEPSSFPPPRSAFCEDADPSDDLAFDPFEPDVDDSPEASPPAAVSVSLESVASPVELAALSVSCLSTAVSTGASLRALPSTVEKIAIAPTTMTIPKTIATIITLRFGVLPAFECAPCFFTSIPFRYISRGPRFYEAPRHSLIIQIRLQGRSCREDHHQKSERHPRSTIQQPRKSARYSSCPYVPPILYSPRIPFAYLRSTSDAKESFLIASATSLTERTLVSSLTHTFVPSFVT